LSCGVLPLLTTNGYWLPLNENESTHCWKEIGSVPDARSAVSAPEESRGTSSALAYSTFGPNRPARSRTPAVIRAAGQ
jgi:hypothetical protein